MENDKRIECELKMLEKMQELNKIAKEYFPEVNHVSVAFIDDYCRIDALTESGDVILAATVTHDANEEQEFEFSIGTYYSEKPYFTDYFKKKGGE